MRQQEVATQKPKVIQNMLKIFPVDKNNNNVMYSSVVPPIGNVSITTTHTGGDFWHALLISKDGMSFSTISAQFTCAYIYLID